MNMHAKGNLLGSIAAALIFVPGHFDRAGAWVPQHYVHIHESPAETAWIPAHYNPNGVWVPGQEGVWVSGHYNAYGQWVPGQYKPA